MKVVPLDRVLINSDTVIRLASDVLGVPKTALEMRRLGFKEEEITKVMYENPKRVFDLDGL
jgi:predicted metal-dependent TIM-barrel fold hydrolase